VEEPVIARLTNLCQLAHTPHCQPRSRLDFPADVFAEGAPIENPGDKSQFLVNVPILCRGFVGCVS